MTDHRCPSCNRPVSGKQEVTAGKPRKAVNVCQKCGALVEIYSYNDGLGVEYGYRFPLYPVRRDR